ncbi:MAG: hypothetical protein FWE21_02525 [Defluviitaleaceae bacterium]|nr:hypothetical protein [Defluviitaleaceae bacterium]
MNTCLSETAAAEAGKFYHGNVMGAETNLHIIHDLFPKIDAWNINSWDNCWYAAFVYWCCIKSGINLPVRCPDPAVSCNFAGVIAWEQWAKLLEVNRWKGKGDKAAMGDIVLFDRVFEDKEHDHIGVVCKWIHKHGRDGV